MATTTASNQHHRQTHQPTPLPPVTSTPSTSINPRKKLTNSKSVIKRRARLAQTTPLSESRDSGIRIARTRSKLSRSVSISRPVVRTSRYTKCELNEDAEFSKATCSSKFRSTGFPDVDGSSSSKKICTYKYCSVHGAGRPQLKRFASIKRPAVIRTKVRQKPSQAENIIQMKTTKQGNSKSVGRAKCSAQDQAREDQASSSPHIFEGSEEVSKDEKPREENEKTTRVWRHIYHSMLSAKYRAELYPLENIDKQADGITDVENNSVVKSAEAVAVIPTLESTQMDAVKLVEDAIDELFLPESKDQLSNNQPIISSGTLEGDVSESKLNDANYFSVDNVKAVKPFSKMGSESLSKNWSKLKQVVLLKRFVKALDKLSELKFREPRFLNVESNPETEKVSLRHQTTDDKRLAGEWMLDYALRQAVAKLTPERRKKVEILIEAFETLIPLSENGTPPSHNQPRSFNSVSSGLLSTQLSSIPFREADEEGITITTDISHTVQKPSIVLTKDTLVLREEPSSVLSQDHPPSLAVCPPKNKLTEVASGVLDKFVSNTQTFRKFEHSLQGQSSTVSSLISHFGDGLGKHIKMESTSSLIRSFDSRYNETEPAKMTKISSALNHVTIHESLKSDSMKQREADVQLDNQKYFKMWGMIYSHVVSGSAAKIGSELRIIDSTKNRVPMDSKLDAVKLVEDALDEMLLPEYEDQSSDDISISSDQDHLERVDSLSGDSEILTPKDSISLYFQDVNQMKAKTSGEACGKACDATHTLEPNMAERSVSKTCRLRSNGWTSLKKFVLLKRFIRALDKLKKFNPREPNYLSLEPDQEPEEISLRHQTTDERLSAEQWMIDNAIQQVVARLTPARKRRVELLVEAFETVEKVLPSTTNRTPLKQTWPSAAHLKHY